MAAPTNTTNLPVLTLPDGTHVLPSIVEELVDLFDIIRRFNDPEIRLIPPTPGRHRRTSFRTSSGLLWRLHPRLRPPAAFDGVRMTGPPEEIHAAMYMQRARRSRRSES